MYKFSFNTLRAALLSLGLMIASGSQAAVDVCDNLQLTIDNQLSNRYDLEIRSIVYKNGEGDGNMHIGKSAAHNEKLAETMHPGFTLWGLLHGTIHAKILINVIDKEDGEGHDGGGEFSHSSIVNTFELNLDAHGSGKVKGLCIINTDLDVQYLDLPDNRKGLITVKQPNQSGEAGPKVAMHVWKLAK